MGGFCSRCLGRTAFGIPIGNLGDITYRAVETLKNVDFIICEDTRVTSVLLHHFEISKPLVVINAHNETKSIESWQFRQF